MNNLQYSEKLNIIKHLTLFDVFNLYKTNKSWIIFFETNSNYIIKILLNNLNKYRAVNKIQYDDILQYIKKDFELGNDVLYKKNTCINLLYLKIYNYYYKYNSLDLYTNYIEILLLYNFLYIVNYYIHSDHSRFSETNSDLTYNYNYHVELCDSLPKQFNNIRLEFYSTIINKSDDPSKSWLPIISFKSMYIMLPYITHVRFLYKLIKYDYIEDLSKTFIVGIYTESHKDIIKKIVHIRRYNQQDYLISHNYYMIKNLFKNRYFKYYDLMIYYEKESILDLISIRDPLIGKIVYVSELDWKHLFLYDEQINQNYNLKQIIIDKQNELVDLYFNESSLRTL